MWIVDDGRTSQKDLWDSSLMGVSPIYGVWFVGCTYFWGATCGLHPYHLWGYPSVHNYIHFRGDSRVIAHMWGASHKWVESIDVYNLWGVWTGENNIGLKKCGVQNNIILWTPDVPLKMSWLSTFGVQPISSAKSPQKWIYICTDGLPHKWCTIRTDGWTDGTGDDKKITLLHFMCRE